MNTIGGGIFYTRHLHDTTMVPEGRCVGCPPGPASGLQPPETYKRSPDILTFNRQQEDRGLIIADVLLLKDTFFSPKTRQSKGGGHLT